jgi:hypothetical protein
MLGYSYYRKHGKDECCTASARIMMMMMMMNELGQKAFAETYCEMGDKIDRIIADNR